ncbi:hypothetical protein BB561_003165 [Smittium simulii]|uniref:Uncharacterized protein n=1 Tax=Smittium simulii TaxID=133385 RepID=A0A2T9YML8_9FUNG|nr:hypothetical protein BB561_003165 [Smittium simulii]
MSFSDNNQNGLADNFSACSDIEHSPYSQSSLTDIKAPLNLEKNQNSNNSFYASQKNEDSKHDLNKCLDPESEEFRFDSEALFINQDTDKKLLQTRFIEWDGKMKDLQTKIIETIDSRLLVQSENICQLTETEVNSIQQKEKRRDDIISKLKQFVSVLHQLQNSIFDENDSLDEVAN